MKSIKFTPEMVQAILDGRKTQTRRPIKSECPYNVGDTLFVQEPFLEVRDYSVGFREVQYKADFEQDVWDEFMWNDHSSLSQEDSRLHIKITDIRAERLRDISDKDCLAEGINTAFIPLSYAFFYLWDSIYGNQPGKRWNDNPFVWVYEFEVVEQ